MTVRHVVAQGNVGTDGFILDPRRVRHGALRAGRVLALAGEVDPQTHLNLDFPDHRLDSCVVVERLEVGAGVIPAGGATARVASDAARPLGRVDVGARRAAWVAAVRARQDIRARDMVAGT